MLTAPSRLARARSLLAPSTPKLARPQGRRRTSVETRYTTSVVRQFSLWPFGTRTVQLHVVMDPDAADRAQLQGLFRAMEKEFSRSETRSQSATLRSTILASHYVLHHHNRHLFPEEWTTASVVCAVSRGSAVLLGLVGVGGAFLLSNGIFHTKRCGNRFNRPLGVEETPEVDFWIAPFHPGDRLALISGGRWREEEIAPLVRRILALQPRHQAQEQLEELLSAYGAPARVLVVEAGSTIRG